MDKRQKHTHIECVMIFSRMQMLVEAPSERQVRDAYVWGSVFLTIGIMLGAFIIWALLTH